MNYYPQGDIDSERCKLLTAKYLLTLHQYKNTWIDDGRNISYTLTTKDIRSVLDLILTVCSSSCFVITRDVASIFKDPLDSYIDEFKLLTNVWLPEEWKDTNK